MSTIQNNSMYQSYVLDEDYTIREDAIGLTNNLPNTCAETIHSVIKDVLLRCALPVEHNVEARPLLLNVS